MKVEIDYDPREALQTVSLPDGKRAFIVDLTQYDAVLNSKHSVVLEKKT